MCNEVNDWVVRSGSFSLWIWEKKNLFHRIYFDPHRPVYQKYVCCYCVHTIISYYDLWLHGAPQIYHFSYNRWWSYFTVNNKLFFIATSCYLYFCFVCRSLCMFLCPSPCLVWRSEKWKVWKSSHWCISVPAVPRKHTSPSPGSLPCLFLVLTWWSPSIQRLVYTILRPWVVSWNTLP